MCIPNQMDNKFSASDFDKVTHEGGELKLRLSDFSAQDLPFEARLLGDVCEVMGEVELSEEQIIAATDVFDITVEMHVTSQSTTTSNDYAGTSQSDFEQVMRDGGKLTWSLNKTSAFGFNAAVYNLGELFAERGHVFSGAIHTLKGHFDYIVEVHLTPKTK